MKNINIYFEHNGQTRIGDQIILTDLPENLYNAGFQVINKSNNPFLKHNPFVKNDGSDIRDLNFNDVNIHFLKNSYRVFSRSEALLNYLNVEGNITLTKPRFYIHESNKKENIILIHTDGKQPLPDHIIEYIEFKYKENFRLIQIVHPDGREFSCFEQMYFDFYNDEWENVAELASRSVMFIGVDSWIAHFVQAYISNVKIFFEYNFMKYLYRYGKNCYNLFDNSTEGNFWHHYNNFYFNETEQPLYFSNPYTDI